MVLYFGLMELICTRKIFMVLKQIEKNPTISHSKIFMVLKQIKKFLVIKIA